MSANLAGWYGNSTTPLTLAPFAAVFGGLAQFVAGVWSFRARDTLATAMHGMWGSFWMAYGILFVLGAAGVLPLPTGSTNLAFAYWFYALAAITLIGMVAAMAESLSLTLVLGTLAAGSALLAVSWTVGSATLLTVGAWVLLVSSWLAAYPAGAMMIAATWKRTVLPIGSYRKAQNVPGQAPTHPIEYPEGMPGSRVGQ